MKVRLSALVLLMFAWLFKPANGFALPAKCDALITEANKLMAEAKDNLALERFEEALQAEPGCYEALWKASILNNRIGLRYSDLLAKQVRFDKAWRFADEALCANPEGAEGNYVMALSVYNKAMVLGVKERMQRTKVVKFYLERSLALDPKYADAWQLLGRWHFKNANLNIAEKASVKFLFGGLPDDASNEMAVVALQNAIKYNPANISYYYDLAVVFKEMQKPDLCAVTLQEAANLKPVTADDLEISRRCRTILNEVEKS